MSQQLEQGLVSIFTGDGKGKTTAAIGAVVRAAGHGRRIFIVYFLKGSDCSSGENRILSKLPNVTLAGFGQKCWVNEGSIQPEDKEQARLALAAAAEAINSGDYDMVVMDEINIALKYGLIQLEDVKDIIENKPEKVELILTGRYADPGLVKMADLVLEVLMIKHPYNRGVMARQGIEY